MTASPDEEHDAIVVGAGVAGALTAKRLVEAGLRVLVLEAGPAGAMSRDGYEAQLETFYADARKGAESPWPPGAGAPQPDGADLAHGTGYFVQQGPQTYGSTYTRRAGGSTLHWLGVSLRMLPEDFALRTRHGVGVDWPLTYDDLEPWYRKAETALGVAADVADQAHNGLTFAPGYDYPMRRIPPSWSDKQLAARVDGLRIDLSGESYALKVRSYPAARNGVPRGGYVPLGAIDLRDDGAIDTFVGQRCQGNTACTPICPVQAKYNAMKTLAQAQRGQGRRGGVRLLAQAVASEIRIDPETGEVLGIEYKRYEDAASPRFTSHVARGRVYVLAAHAVENAKLMLASGLGGPLVGRHLMDHPALYAWGLAGEAIGAFRGPLSTSGIEDLRGGAFRGTHAAFRFDIGNDGWRAPGGAPDSSVADAVLRQKLTGARLRETLAATLARQVRFSMAIEQLPDPANAVSIKPQYRDDLGNPRPVLTYSVDAYTGAGMAQATRVAAAIFAKAGIADHTAFAAGTQPNVTHDGVTYHYHGMGHFAGTHRMGAARDGSVVDADQRAWGHRNLFLVGAGSMPTMGTSNPTLTLAALALRTAERLVADLT